MQRPSTYSPLAGREGDSLLKPARSEIIDSFTSQTNYVINTILSNRKQGSRFVPSEARATGEEKFTWESGWTVITIILGLYLGLLFFGNLFKVV
jgi:hypothetical protein